MIRFARQFEAGKWFCPSQLPGVSTYGASAWHVFCCGEPLDIPSQVGRANV